MLQKAHLDVAKTATFRVGQLPTALVTDY